MASKGDLKVIMYGKFIKSDENKKLLKVLIVNELCF